MMPNYSFLIQYNFRYVSDVKAVEIGHEVRFKAEVAFDGKELAQLLFESSEGREILQVSWAVCITFLWWHISAL